MTIRTISYLNSTLLADGQSAGAITPARMRDLVDTLGTNTSDDLANASALGAPAIIRGTVYGHLASGVTVGAGQTTGVRQATATGLQNAITYAANNNKIFQLNEGVYEINSSTGLVIPANGGTNYEQGFVWRGARDSQIVQFYNTTPGAPILTIGDITGTNTFQWLDFEGVQLRYGIAQTGFTSAEALVLGSIAWSNLGKILIPAATSFRPYNGVTVNTGGTRNFFSNTIRDLGVWTVQNTFLNLGLIGTGNTYENIYLNNGGMGSFTAITGKYVDLQSADEQHFRQLNCEWGSCNTVMDIESSLGCIIEAFHLEGVVLTGFNPCVLMLANTSIHIDTMNVENLYCRTANITGNCRIVRDYSTLPSNLTITNLNLKTYSTAMIDTALTIIQPDATAGLNHGVFSIDKMTVSDTAGGANQFIGLVNLDSHMPVTSSRFLVPQRFRRYEWGVSGSKLEGAVISVSATYTHYGQQVDATLIVPASITSFTITLSNLMGATGTQSVATGTRVHITRLSGSASGTLTVRDDTPTTLTTNTTAPADLDYIFNGTHYVTFTPVT